MKVTNSNHVILSSRILAGMFAIAVLEAGARNGNLSRYDMRFVEVANAWRAKQGAEH